VDAKPARMGLFVTEVIKILFDRWHLAFISDCLGKITFTRQDSKYSVRTQSRSKYTLVNKALTRNRQVLFFLPAWHNQGTDRAQRLLGNSH
jgi:hypothetical protein